MKKFLLSLSLSLIALAGMAQTQYTEKIAVTLDGEAFPDAESTITVTKAEDGTCEFTLPNFMLVDGDVEMPVGTINLKGVPMTAGNGYTRIATQQNIVIVAGDKEGVAEEDWLGPMLGEVPIALEGKLTDTDLYATISISFMEMEIGVVIGEDIPEGPKGEAKDYTEKIAVTLNGEAFPDAESTITVTKYEDGTCEFTLPNFVLGDGETTMPVGTINLKGVPMTEAEGYTQIGIAQNIVIVPGNMEGVDEADWIGPMLGEVPIALEGKLTDTDLYATISISFMDMEIGVVIGEDIPEAPKGESKDYTEKIAVTLNGEAFPDAESTITVTKYEDGTCEFTLPNFVLGDGETTMPVGTINLKGVPMTEAEGYTQIGIAQNIVIVPGNMEGVDEADWIGPMLGEVPIALEGKLTDTSLYATISISFMEMEIGVVIGEDPQAGIGEVTATTNSDKVVYDLKGVRVANSWSNALPKGIYIVGGKKVMK